MRATAHLRYTDPMTGYSFSLGTPPASASGRSVPAPPPATGRGFFSAEKPHDPYAPAPGEPDGMSADDGMGAPGATVPGLGQAGGYGSPGMAGPGRNPFSGALAPERSPGPMNSAPPPSMMTPGGLYGSPPTPNMAPRPNPGGYTSPMDMPGPPLPGTPPLNAVPAGNPFMPRVPPNPFMMPGRM